ncbi:MAG: T9SS type A sorting domain-containing protein, partial [Flavobacterium sp.]|nr:T9SS type A sorting domain-containing protein [Candidatus Neoflavobacterium equi]
SGYVLNFENVANPIIYFFTNFHNFDLPTDSSNQATATSTGAIFPLEINYNCATASATDFNQSKMAVYPTPATNNIQIACLTQDQKYGIFNVLGAQVASGMAPENTSININKLSNGMYFIKLDNGQHLKFIKE